MKSLTYGIKTSQVTGTRIGIVVLSYLLGSFPTGVVLSRRKYGLDVREMGSGNIGATNITRVFGWYAGVLVFIIDYVKGLLPVYLVASYLPGEEWLLTYVGAALVLGHCYSAYLRFKGGKGVATSLGCLTAVIPWGAMAAAAVYALLLGVTRISAVGSLGGLIAAWAYLIVARPAPSVSALVVLISVVVLIRHKSNIQRLLGGLKRKPAS